MIVASLPVMAEHVSFIPDPQRRLRGCVGKALPANRIRFGLF